MALRIFHSADWHFGKMMGSIDRTADFEAFIDTFLALVDERRPDILLLAGDVFDTSLPSNAAQKLYYTLISRLRETSVRQIVIAAGNHDSQRFLEAPRALLETLHCFIAGDRPEEQILVIRDAQGKPQLGIAAVPYLRESRVRSGSMDFTANTRAELFEAGVRAHYDHVWQLLDEALAGARVPRIAMGHLFVVGSELRPGVKRDPQAGQLNVGSINSVSTAAFAQGWDYVALGHIHHAQVLEAASPMRYAGSPIALTFNHRKYTHSIVEVTLSEKGELDIVTIPVPQQRAFVHVEGSLAELLEQIAEAGRAHADEAPAFVEAVLTSGETEPRLTEILKEAAERARVLLLSIRNERAAQAYLREEQALLELADLTPAEVFRLYMTQEGRETSPETLARYQALLSETHQAVLAGRRPDDEEP